MTYVLLVLASAVLYLIGTLPMAPVAMVTYAPVLFGAWLGIKGRGRPYRIYALAGLSVGLLVASFLVAEIVAADDNKFFRNNLGQVSINVHFFSVAPTLLFTSGALFGDVIKRRAWAQSYSEPTTDLDTTLPAGSLSIRATVIWGVIGTIAAAVITALRASFRAVVAVAWGSQPVANFGEAHLLGGWVNKRRGPVPVGATVSGRGRAVRSPGVSETPPTRPRGEIEEPRVSTLRKLAEALVLETRDLLAD